MPFGNIGPTELIFLMIFLLLIFGAKRLPELGSGLGKGIREFKKSMREINTEIDPKAFEINVPPDAASLTLEELRRAGPLGDRSGG